MQQLEFLPVLPRVRRVYDVLLVAWLVTVLLMTITHNLFFWYFSSSMANAGYDYDYEFFDVLVKVVSVIFFLLYLLSSILLLLVEWRVASEFRSHGLTLPFVGFVLLMVTVFLSVVIELVFFLANMHVLPSSVYDTMSYVTLGSHVLYVLVLIFAGSVVALNGFGQLRTAGVLLLLSLVFFVMDIVFYSTIGKEIFAAGSYGLYYMVAPVLFTIRYVLIFMGLNKIIVAQKLEA